jgi:hypothetical protein
VADEAKRSPGRGVDRRAEHQRVGYVHAVVSDQKDRSASAQRLLEVMNAEEAMAVVEPQPLPDSEHGPARPGGGFRSGEALLELACRAL